MTDAPDAKHLGVLDGWRGISILLVLATHLFPMGPKSWQLNQAGGPAGMALFFTLSGFLITRFLLERPDIPEFLTRRFFRIIPLAWVSLAVALPLAGAPASSYLPNFLFYANLPPMHMTQVASHFWSLCVEMQFYVGIALLVGVLGRRGLYLLPALCVAVTVHRAVMGTYVDIVTYRRVDEILAGATMSLAYAGMLGKRTGPWMGRLNPYVLIALFAVACHPAGGFANYFRPYIAALLVGSTLYRTPPRLEAVLKSRSLAYIAAISYALYVLHALLDHTWLGSGDKLIRYLKRPLLLAATFALAHLSTFYFERPCIEFGKRLRRRSTRPQPAASAPQ